MSDDPVAREAPDEAADARAIDVAEAADASAEALAEALAEAPPVAVEDAVGLARLRLLGDEPAPFEADLPEARVAVEDSDNAVLRSGLAEAVEVEQFSTTRWGDLARNTVTVVERADPPRAPRPVFDRPGDFARAPGFADPRGWPAQTSQRTAWHGLPAQRTAPGRAERPRKRAARTVRADDARGPHVDGLRGLQ